MSIVTRRLELLPASVPTLRADLEGPTELAHVLGVDVPESWPPEFYDEDSINVTLDVMQHGPSDAVWWLYYFVRKPRRKRRPKLIGAGGYKGPPDDGGLVEIGYSILPEFQRMGYGTEAARGLVDWAFRHHMVHGIVAETLPSLRGSIAILTSLEFVESGPGHNPDSLRFELPRVAYRSPASV